MNKKLILSYLISVRGKLGLGCRRACYYTSSADFKIDDLLIGIQCSRFYKTAALQSADKSL